MRLSLLFLGLLLPALHAADLLVAAASDLAPMAQDLTAGALQAGLRVRFTFASSGSLAQQIESGAPYDVYLSASADLLLQLRQKGLVDAPVPYGLGRIALWSPSGLIHSLNDLTKPQVLHIAIANPEHAPYGAAAKQALETRGLWNSVQNKLVYGENVRQALQFAESGNADAVITAWTLLKGRGILLPAEWHQPLRQVGAVVKSSPEQISAKRFLQFLVSPAGRKILLAGGLFQP